MNGLIEKVMHKPPVHFCSPTTRDQMPTFASTKGRKRPSHHQITLQFDDSL